MRVTAAFDSYTAPARKGVWPWLISLLALVIPGLAAIIAVPVAVFVYHFYNKHEDRGAINARNAANVVITYAIITVACGIVFFGAPQFIASVPAAATALFVLGLLALGFWAIVSIVLVVLSIWGMVAAGRGEVFDAFFVVRVIKGPRSWESAQLDG